MTQIPKRWSIPYKDSYLITDNSGKPEVIKLHSNIEALRDIIVSGTTEELELDGWDMFFGDEQYNLYTGAGNYKDDYNELMTLTKQGYDVRPQWRRFKQVLQDIWVALPEFYKGYNADHETRATERGFSYQPINPPLDYNPNKPFPNLPVPQDIDE